MPKQPAQPVVELTPEEMRAIILILQQSQFNAASAEWDIIGVPLRSAAMKCEQALDAAGMIASQPDE